jgi:diguanylate cyclase (GGDEF)-like protein
MRNAWARAIARAAWLLALIAGSPAGRCEQMNLQEFGQPDGLGNLALNALQQDAQGFLWIGTDNGLYRHDGQRIERVATQELRRVIAMASAGGHLWVLSESGAWWWHDGRLERVLAPDVQVAGDSPMAIAARGDEAWFVTRTGIQHVSVDRQAGTWSSDAVLTPAQLASHPEMGRPVGVMLARDGALWAGCGDAICRWHRGELKRWDARGGVPRQEWHALLEASDGSIWARSTQATLQLAGRAEVFIDRTAPSDRGDPMHRYPLVEDASHRILTASQHGVLRWQGQGWEFFGKRQGLPGDGRVHALLSDRDGGLWLGLRGTGLLQWRGYGRWETWTDADGLPSSVVWTMQRAGNGNGNGNSDGNGSGPLHVGTGRGLAVLDAARGSFRSVPLPHAGDVLQLTPDGQGGLWAVTDVAALHRVHDARVLPGALVTPGGTEDGFNRALTARDGALWVLTPGKLQRWAVPGQGQAQRVPGPPGDEQEGFTDLCETPDGTLWFAGHRALARHRAGHWLPSVPVDGGAEFVACGADGSVVAASEGGRTWRVRAPGGAQPSLQALEGPPLQGRLIMSLLIDSRGWLWFGTDAGLVAHDGTHWKLLDRSQGLAWNDTSGYALYEDGDRSLWIGTSRGLSRLIDPAAVFATDLPRPVLMAATRGAARVPVRDGETLAWTRDRIQLRMASLQFSDRRLRIEHRVAGRDEGWIASASPEIELSGLEPGAYRIELRLADPETGRHSAPAAFGFALEPPWWHRAWARALGLCALVALSLGGYLWRRHQWRTRQLRLEQLVRERTRELEASRAQLEELASRDALTGLWNRRALADILRREVVRARRERTPLTLAIVDIDHFKQVNDTHGHPAGDAVLKDFAGRLAGAVRPYDAVGRLGGEEFCLVLPGLDLGQTDDRERLRRMQVEVSRAPTVIGVVTSSFGAAMLGADTLDDERLLEAADQALYRAKRGGRNQVAFHEAGIAAPPAARDHGGEDGAPGTTLSSIVVP